MVRSALLDSNLWVLLIIGTANRDYISTHKRVNEFTVEDYDLLIRSLSGYEQLWITSHCLAEVSNLLLPSSRKSSNNKRPREIMETFNSIINTTGEVKESHINKNITFSNKIVYRLGVADSGFLQKSKSVTCSFTVDLNLYLEVSSLQKNVVNFNHFRQPKLLS